MIPASDAESQSYSGKEKQSLDVSAVGSEKTEQILQLKGHSCPFVMLSQGEPESSREFWLRPQV